MAYTTVDKSGDYFNTHLYSGTGSSNAVTGVGFQPDLVWIKDRENTYSHTWTDAVRGTSKELYSNNNSAETSYAQGVTAFGADGFTLGTDAGINSDGDDKVSWNWKAGTTSGITTNGSTTITPSAYSFNATSGFAILKYTGNATDDAKLAHGIGIAPHFVICKEMTVAANDWAVWHKELGTAVLALNTTAAEVAGNSRFSSTVPDTVNITLGSDNSTNKAANMICYAWASVRGYSKFGKYIGNNNVDGPFVYTGFQPAMVLIKRKDSGENWTLYDNKRLGFNPQTYGLRPNTNLVESQYSGSGSDRGVDFTACGFKFRESGTNMNNGSFVYGAFAKHPLVSTGNVPSTAR